MLEIGTEPWTWSEEIDGNTVNQPLVHKVLQDYLSRHDVTAWARGLRERTSEIPERMLAIVPRIHRRQLAPE